MANTVKNHPPVGKDLWVKPYTNKNLSTHTFSFDGDSKKLFRKKEKAALKHELRKDINSGAWVEEIWSEEDVELEELGFYDPY